MTNKTTRIISLVLMILISLSLVMSGVMKLMGGKQVVEGLTKIGLGNYITLLGIIELVSVALLFIPKTYNLGFLLITAYLGGAISIELASGQVPSASIFMAILWVAMFLKNKAMFLEAPVKE